GFDSHAHRAEAGPVQPGVRGYRHEILRTLPAHRRGHEPRRWGGRGHRAVGRTGYILLRRPSLTRRQHATLESALDGRTHSALRRRDTRTGAPGKAPGLQTPP